MQQRLHGFCKLSHGRNEEVLGWACHPQRVRSFSSSETSIQINKNLGSSYDRPGTGGEKTGGFGAQCIFNTVSSGPCIVSVSTKPWEHKRKSGGKGIKKQSSRVCQSLGSRDGREVITAPAGPGEAWSLKRDALQMICRPPHTTRSSEGRASHQFCSE